MPSGPAGVTPEELASLEERLRVAEEALAQSQAEHETTDSEYERVAPLVEPLFQTREALVQRLLACDKRLSPLRRKSPASVEARGPDPVGKLTITVSQLLARARREVQQHDETQRQMAAASKLGGKAVELNTQRDSTICHAIGALASAKVAQVMGEHVSVEVATKLDRLLADVGRLGQEHSATLAQRKHCLSIAARIVGEGSVVEQVAAAEAEIDQLHDAPPAMVTGDAALRAPPPDADTDEPSVEAQAAAQAEAEAQAEAQRQKQAKAEAQAEAQRQKEAEAEAEAQAEAQRRKEAEAEAQAEAQRQKEATAAEVARQEQQQQQEAEAATVIQAAARGMRARRASAELKQQRLQQEAEKAAAAAAAAAQAQAEAAAAEAEAAEQAIAAATTIQSGFRGMQARRASAELKQQRAQEAHEEAAATKIQSGFRGMQARRASAELKQQRVQEAREHAAATAIQSGFRGMQARRESADLREQRERADQRLQREAEAAITIQSGFRGMQARRASADLRADRAQQGEDADRHLLELRAQEEELAAIKIQSGFRGMQARRASADLRSQHESTHQRAEHEERAAVTIQSGFRGMQARRASADLRQQRAQELTHAREEQAATTIQASFRGMQARRASADLKHDRAIARSEQAIQNKAATTIQSGFRGMQARRTSAQLRAEQHQHEEEEAGEGAQQGEHEGEGVEVARILSGSEQSDDEVELFSPKSIPERVVDDAIRAALDEYLEAPEVRQRILMRRLGYLQEQFEALQDRTEFLSSQHNLMREYMGITIGDDSPAEVSMDRRNAHLNRYSNVMAYDHSRVRVTPAPLNGFNDYINANYVDGYQAPNFYVCAQGPLPHTETTFWQMVWEQNTDTIVMVTNLVEGGRAKCHRYWPTEAHPQRYGPFDITFLGEEDRDTIVVRRFEVALVRGIFGDEDDEEEEDEEDEEQAEGGKGGHPAPESRIITHVQFVGWPDHGAPNTTDDMIDFVRLVRELRDPTKGPAVVHCSAGVGRTGTFIALERLMGMCADGQELDAKAVVEDMRTRRNMLVQAPVQYQFVHHAILDVVHEEMGRTQLQLARLHGKPELTPAPLSDGYSDSDDDDDDEVFGEVVESTAAEPEEYDNDSFEADEDEDEDEEDGAEDEGPWDADAFLEHMGAAAGDPSESLEDVLSGFDRDDQPDANEEFFDDNASDDQGQADDEPPPVPNPDYDDEEGPWDEELPVEEPGVPDATQPADDEEGPWDEELPAEAHPTAAIAADDGEEGPWDEELPPPAVDAPSVVQEDSDAVADGKEKQQQQQQQQPQQDEREEEEEGPWDEELPPPVIQVEPPQPDQEDQPDASATAEESQRLSAAVVPQASEESEDDFADAADTFAESSEGVDAEAPEAETPQDAAEAGDEDQGEGEGEDGGEGEDDGEDEEDGEEGDDAGDDQADDGASAAADGTSNPSGQSSKSKKRRNRKKGKRR